MLAYLCAPQKCRSGPLNPFSALNNRVIANGYVADSPVRRYTLMQAAQCPGVTSRRGGTTSLQS